MTFRVFYSEQAEQDLMDIYFYVACSLFAPQAADKLQASIHASIMKLDTLPLRYPCCAHEPWASMGVRVMPVESYLVFYLPDESESTVAILRIMYAKRDIATQIIPIA